MSKKKKAGQALTASQAGVLDVVSSRGKKVMGVGAAAVVLGYIALSRADALGRNPASLLSCILLLGGYAAIGAGLFLGDRSPSEIPSVPTQKTS